MDSDKQEKLHKQLSNAVAVGKDLVSLLRDGALFSLAILLIVFPQQFNTMLVNAGFEEGSVVGFKWKSKLKDSNEALQKAEATIKKLNAKNVELSKVVDHAIKELDNPDLTKTLTTIESETKSLFAEAKQTELLVTQTIDSNTPLVNKVISRSALKTKHEKSDYLVGLQTLGVTDAKRESINEKLSADGYALDDVTYSYETDDRPSWFAYNSTIFYYSSTSRTAAQNLAKFMQSVTGQSFAVQRGAGLGVDPDKKAITFFIHYILK